jgi:carboxymethylenebutenolidase
MDQRFIDLYNHYVHGGVNRRGFLSRLGVLAGSTAAASAILPLLENDMARAETVPETDPRLTTGTVDVPGVPGLKGYLARPAGSAVLPAVLVIHENRGLNAHIRDVTRRLALEGYVALGLDYLSPLGGTPEDSDAATAQFRELTPEGVLASGQAALTYLDTRPDATGKVGAIGFCWGGGQVNTLAVHAATLDAGVAYYGGQPSAEMVTAIEAPLLLQYAGLDERINAGVPAYEAALKAGGKAYELHVYPDVNHGFNNDTNAARFNQAAADLAWSRSLAFFARNLGG